MPTRLTGHPSLPYLGVEAPQPPNIVAIRRAPTVNDYLTFNTGDLWIDIASLSASPPTAPTAENVWMLVSKNKQIANATWVNFAGGGGGNVGQFTADAGANPVLPDGAGNVNVFGGPTLPGLGPNAFTNINTFAQLNTIRVDLNNSIIQPFTNAAGTTGVYSLGVTSIVADRFMHGYGTNNTFLGRQAGNLTLTVANASENTCVGTTAGASLLGTAAQDGSANTFVGAASGAFVTDGLANVFVGSGSGLAATLTEGDVFLGSGSGSALVTGNANVFAGFNSGNAYTTNESSNTIVGFDNNGRIGENNTIRIGSRGRAPGTENIFIGRDTGTSAYTVATAINNTFVGSVAGGAALTTGLQNTAIGSLAGSGGLTTGSRNTLLGYNAGINLTTTNSDNICIGTLATAKAGEVGVIRIICSDGGGPENIFIGQDAGNNTYTTANNCMGLGNNTLNALTTADHVVAIGDSALLALTTGGNCIGIGEISLAACTTGQQNTSVGAASGRTLITGSNNSYFGYLAGSAHVGAESDNVIIGANVGGTAAETNTLRIGTATGGAAGAGQLNKTFICGIRGITTAVNDAIPVLVDSANQLGTVSSSERYKDNIEDMDEYSEDILSLRCVTFNFKNHSPEVVSVGLIAEEVEEIMPQLVIKDKEGQPETVRYLDIIPMLLNEVQKLEKRVKELESKL